MNSGYLTTAYGNVFYLELAVTLSCSLKTYDSGRKLSLVVDQQLKDKINELNYYSFFDQIIVLDNQKLNGFAGKLHAAKMSPYDYTVFLDSDFIAVKNTEKVWREMTVFDLNITGGIKFDGFVHHVSITEILDVAGVKYLPVYNSGCFSYNSSGKKIFDRAIEIMNDGHKFKVPYIEPRGFQEDTALGIALAEKEILPLPLYTEIHYSLYNSSGILKLNIKKGVCGFVKQGIKRSPVFLHYTPLGHIGFSHFINRWILQRELNKLRKSYNLKPVSFFYTFSQLFRKVIKKLKMNGKSE